MAIFAKSNQQTNLKTNTTIISGSTKIKGTINSDCPIVIDGKHEGIIEAGQTVTIGRSGEINGDIAAKMLTITGMFHGIADCESVEVLSGGSLRGKVIAKNLTIDQNCHFEGESINRSTNSATKASSNDTRPNKIELPNKSNIAS